MLDVLHALIGTAGQPLSALQMSARAVVVFMVGLTLVRLAGKRVRGRWGAFDIIVFVVIGSNLSRGLTGNAPFVPVVVATAVLLAVHAGLAQVAVRWRALGPLLKGRPAGLMTGGELDAQALRRHAVGEGDLAEALREHGLANTSQAEEIWLERNGGITVIKKSDSAD